MDWSYDFSNPHIDNPIVQSICAIIFSAIMAVTFFILAVSTFLMVRDVARERGQSMWRALPSALFQIFLAWLLCCPAAEDEDNVSTPLIGKNNRKERDACQNV